MNTLQYVDLIRSKKGITSDYAVAKALGVSKQAAGRYCKGLGQFDDSVVPRVAEILEIHPGLVMLDMHRERTKDVEIRGLWEEIRQGFRAPLQHANSGLRASLTW